MSEFVDTLQSALDDRDAQVAQERVHNAVIAEVKRLDPGVRIRHTEHFNHSYVPDFVLTWSADGGDEERERQLYLRLDVQHRSFVEDLRWVHEGGPMFLGLRPGGDNGGFEYALSEGDPKERCLVTASDALDEWTPQTQQLEGTLATSALVRSGRGLVDHRTATAVGHAINEGLPALFAGQDPDKVNHALDVLTPLLPSEEGERLERRFWFFWLGSGGIASDLQRAGFGLGSLDADELRGLLHHLFRRQHIPNPDYWHQLGIHLSAHELGELMEIQPPSPNLDALVRANVSGWTARGAGAQAHAAVPLEPSFGWCIDQKMLALDVGDLRVFFTDDKRHFNNWSPDGRVRAWAELRPLLANHNLVEVEALTPENEVRVRRREGRRLRSESEDLDRLMGERSHDAVVGVTVEVPGTAAEAKIDFRRRVLDAGDDNVPIRTMALLAARYLSGISEERIEHLSEFLDAPWVSAAGGNVESQAS